MDSDPEEEYEKKTDKDWYPYPEQEEEDYYYEDEY